MPLVPAMSTLSERNWVDVWEAEQATLDRVGADRDTWLPHVVETREWGALRWTSGRPEHAAETGTAVAETFAVLRPESSSGEHAAAVGALRSQPPVVTVVGKGLRRASLVTAAVGGCAGLALALVLGLASGTGAFDVVVWTVLGVLLGAVAAVWAEREVRRQRRNRALVGNADVRVVTGRYAPESWARLIRAVSVVESTTETARSDAVRAAVWEAAGLLLSSSDHAEVDVLADGMERLTQP